MPGDEPERGARRGDRVRAAVVAVERGAVVDAPQRVVPDEEVRVLRGAVDVLDQRVEPDDRRSELRIGREARGRADVSEPGRKSIARFVPALAFNKSWIS